MGISKHDRETGFAVAETLMHRLPVLWWQMLSPSAAGRAEIDRMVAEKQRAFVDGVAAAQAQLLQEALRFGWVNPMAAWQRVARAAFNPASLTVRANARRLRK